MKRMVVTLLFLLIVLPASSLYACEDCVAKGGTDPVGNKHDTDMCWSGRTGIREGCSIDDHGKCVMWDYDLEACPEKSKDPGTGGGDSGQDCTRDATGACPPSCMSCAKGGGR